MAQQSADKQPAVDKQPGVPEVTVIDATGHQAQSPSRLAPRRNDGPRRRLRKPPPPPPRPNALVASPQHSNASLDQVADLSPKAASELQQLRGERDVALEKVQQLALGNEGRLSGLAMLLRVCVSPRGPN